MKVVTIKGEKYMLLKLKGIWYYKNHRCHCPCNKRIPWKRSQRQHGVSLFRQGHSSYGKKATLETRKKLIDAHLISQNRWNNRRHSNTKKSKERASESMKKFHQLGYQGKDIYDLYSYIRRCIKQCEKQDLGFNPLNAPFTGSILHHVNSDDVIFIPIDIHRTHGHKLSNPKAMNRINKIAMTFKNDKEAKKIKKILKQLEK